MTPLERTKVAGTAFTVCMFSIAGLAQFLEYRNWAIWPIGALLAAAFVCLFVAGRETKRLSNDWSDKQ